MIDLKERLEAMRDTVRGAIAADAAMLGREVDEKGEDLTPSQHPADVASDLYAREELVSDELRLTRELRAIEEALSRIAAGAYGRCDDCGRAIPRERLEAVPTASRCIDCQRALDRRRR